MITVEQIVAIIRKHIAECEEAAAKYDEMQEYQYWMPPGTLQRKQYAIDAQISRLQTILEEIEAHNDHTN